MATGTIFNPQITPLVSYTPSIPCSQYGREKYAIEGNKCFVWFNVGLSSDISTNTTFADLSSVFKPSFRCIGNVVDAQGHVGLLMFETSGEVIIGKLASNLTGTIYGFVVGAK